MQIGIADGSYVDYFLHYVIRYIFNFTHHDCEHVACLIYVYQTIIVPLMIVKEQNIYLCITNQNIVDFVCHNL